MSESWLVSFPCDRQRAEAFDGDLPDLSLFDEPSAIVAVEEDEDLDRWRIDVYAPTKPSRAYIDTVAKILKVPAPLPTPERLPDEDWVTLSQQGLEPVQAGRFYIHTDNDPPSNAPGIVNLLVNASQAFGTGHHDTTAGCLQMLDDLRRGGRRYDNIADIGTGTDLLAFAAMHLWPRAYCIASDIDPVSIVVSVENALANNVRIGDGSGQLALVVSDGTTHPAIGARAPYDLVIANILAGPLITLAPALAAITAPGGTVILAGLIERQRADVIRAYRRQGFRVDRRGSGDWPALVLTKRNRLQFRAHHHISGSAGQPPGDFGAW